MIPTAESVQRVLTAVPRLWLLFHIHEIHIAWNLCLIQQRSIVASCKRLKKQIRAVTEIKARQWENLSVSTQNSKQKSIQWKLKHTCNYATVWYGMFPVQCKLNHCVSIAFLFSILTENYFDWQLFGLQTKRCSNACLIAFHTLKKYSRPSLICLHNVECVHAVHNEH